MATRYVLDPNTDEVVLVDAKGVPIGGPIQAYNPPAPTPQNPILREVETRNPFSPFIGVPTTPVNHLERPVFDSNWEEHWNVPIKKPTDISISIHLGDRSDIQFQVNGNVRSTQSPLDEVVTDIRTSAFGQYNSTVNSSGISPTDFAEKYSSQTTPCTRPGSSSYLAVASSEGFDANTARQDVAVFTRNASALRQQDFRDFNASMKDLSHTHRHQNNTGGNGPKNRIPGVVYVTENNINQFWQQCNGLNTDIVVRQNMYHKNDSLSFKYLIDGIAFNWNRIIDANSSKIYIRNFLKRKNRHTTTLGEIVENMRFGLNCKSLIEFHLINLISHNYQELAMKLLNPTQPTPKQTFSAFFGRELA
ncbi:hypothetical protein [Carp edema virus]|nr:hypothetical protein [Carp edema virus]